MTKLWGCRSLEKMLKSDVAGGYTPAIPELWEAEVGGS